MVFSRKALKSFLPVAAGIVLSVAPLVSQASNPIRIVGSSTVYPFVTVAAETFSQQSKFKAPVIESTGTGGGFKLFCAGIGKSFPDFSNASRAIKQSEVKQCAKNGVKDITEIKIGYDGIVLSNSVEAPKFTLTKKQLFLALAKQVPSKGKLVDNPYQKWNDIDSSLPSKEIAVYGPPPSSGTRDAFVELVMESACKNLPEFKAAYPDKKTRKKVCHLIREDGKYVDSGENDNLIIQKLQANIDALGIFGFGFLEENMETVQGSIIDGVEPTFEAISEGKYSVSRPLFVYAKDEHMKHVPGFREFVGELVSVEAIGEEGYLVEKGLIPLSEGEFAKLQETTKTIQ